MAIFQVVDVRSCGAFGTAVASSIGAIGGSGLLGLGSRIGFQGESAQFPTNWGCPGTKISSFAQLCNTQK